MTWQPDICIYHGHCDDGFGAALAVHLRWGDEVLYVPGQYGKPIDADVTGKRVLFVDFSLKQDAMRELARKAGSIVVLDHHKTAEAELFPWSIGGRRGPPPSLRARPNGQQCALARIDELLALNQMENVEPIVAFFDMCKSGARMAWEFCHPDYDVPRLIEYIEDRDLWRFSFAETRAVSAALRTYPHDFDIWKGFLADTSRLVLEGGTVLRGHQKNIASMCEQTYEMLIGDTKVPAVNTPYHYASDAAHELLQRNPHAPFAVAWFRRGDGMLQFSLRSEDTRADVSVVAQRYGGGGHRNAAGFAIKDQLQPVL